MRDIVDRPIKQDSQKDKTENENKVVFFRAKQKFRQNN